MADNKKAFEWTDENVQLLKDLWNEGVAARDIAEKLGDGVTRNAVIGKANRLGISAPKVTKLLKDKKFSNVTFPDDHCCQWPSGHPEEDGFSFCGKPVQGSRPYCQEHCAVAYRRLSNSGNS